MQITKKHYIKLIESAFNSVIDTLEDAEIAELTTKKLKFIFKTFISEMRKNAKNAVKKG